MTNFSYATPLTSSHSHSKNRQPFSHWYSIGWNSSGETVDTLWILVATLVCLLLLIIYVLKKRIGTQTRELSTNEERYRSLFTHMNECLALCEMVYDDARNPVDYCFKDINPALASMLGIDRFATLGKSAAAVHGMKRPPFIDECARVMASGKPEKFEAHFKRLKKLFRISIFPTENDQFGVIFSDITEARRAKRILEKSHEELELCIQESRTELLKANVELKYEILERQQAETALREQSTLLASILDSAFYGIITYEAMRDESGQIIDFTYLMLNKAATEIICRDDLAGKHMLEEFPENRQNGLFEWCVNIVRRRRHDHIEIYREENLNKWIYSVGVPFNDGITITLSNTTEQKLLQDQLIQAERLAATGELAASIAHEINSPLQGISSILSLMAHNSSEDRELSENLQLLKGAFQNIRDITKSLLDLNRPANTSKQPVDIHTVIKNILLLLRSHLKKNRIGVHLNLLASPPLIEASPQQMGQVLINLVNNAVEAMNPQAAKSGERSHPPKSGTLRISTRREPDAVTIEVSDSGPGIADDTLGNLFRPFYTTKKAVGMGVGLSICKNIIEDHRGKITARNAPEGGAVFTIRLPFSAKPDPVKQR